jgi:hypothetical protein
MKKSIGPFVLAAAIAGGAGALAFAPALAGAASDTTTTTTAPPATATPKADALKSVLDGLVADGTITQDQADKVLSRLQSALPRGGAKGPGVPFGRLKASADEVASYLGLTPAELRTQLEGGKSLAEVAKAQSKSVDGLVDAIVAAETKALEAAVTNGKLTRAQADTLEGKLHDQATKLVNEARPAGLGRGGPGGHNRPKPATDGTGSSLTS